MYRDDTPEPAMAVETKRLPLFTNDEGDRVTGIWLLLTRERGTKRAVRCAVAEDFDPDDFATTTEFDLSDGGAAAVDAAKAYAERQFNRHQVEYRLTEYPEWHHDFVKWHPGWTGLPSR
ncbi:hypothetical protein [Nocardioides sp. KR10-350]|uniref:hypothetical protein n=1 Tax=Nocardioides cheoyonin TaxID=3156615 RepID=UPI0032B3DB93